jgi:hypothetical protein
MAYSMNRVCGNSNRFYQRKCKTNCISSCSPTVSGSRCSCSSFAKDHLRRTQQRQPHLAVKMLELTEAKALGFEVMAAPLLLLFQNQQLIYAGPVATDLLCSDNASLLDGIVSGTTLLPGFWLNGESTACRCRVK